MLNLHEVESAIKELEQGSMTYNNCMKLASLYIIRDELYKRSQEAYYARNYNNMPQQGYGYYPMYDNRMMGKDEMMHNQQQPYHSNPNMAYENDDLIIRKNPKEIY